jgi:hypothetical protein
MKVSIHLTKASRAMTLHNLDPEQAVALCAILRGLPGGHIDAVIVAESAPATCTAHDEDARRAGCAAPSDLQSAWIPAGLRIH